MIDEEYSYLPFKKTTLLNHVQFAMNSDIAEKIFEMTEEESKEIEKISNVFSQIFGNNYVSNTLHTIALLSEEMIFDELTTLCEQVKVKWKIMLELLSVFHYEYLDQAKHGFNQDRYELLIKHQEIMSLRNADQAYASELEKAYKIYKQIYVNGCDREKFNVEFIKLTGYTIDNAGQLQSLNSMVSQFINKFISNEEKQFNQLLKIDYAESQMMSHANGYMWFANTGAWKDVNNIFRFTDRLLLFVLEEIYIVFNCHRIIEDTSKYKMIINILRNGRKRISNLIKDKWDLLDAPTTDI